MTLRSFQATDYPAICELYAMAAPPGPDLPEAESKDAVRYVAVDDLSGEIVGFGQTVLQSEASFLLLVAPVTQRKGVGTALWNRLALDLKANEVTSVRPWVREENLPAIGWLSKQGFAQIDLDGPVSVFLDRVDPSRFGHQNLEGVVISTLEVEMKSDPECLTKLHALYGTVEADVPGAGKYTKTLEEFTQENICDEAMLDAYFIAKSGDEYIGLSYLRERGPDANCVEPRNIQQCLTGVRREYRRRGIAQALKIKTIAYSKEHGYRRLFTNSDNPAMRALNAKLDFSAGPWFVFHKTLS